MSIRTVGYRSDGLRIMLKLSQELSRGRIPEASGPILNGTCQEGLATPPWSRRIPRRAMSGVNKKLEQEIEHPPDGDRTSEVATDSVRPSRRGTVGLA